MISRTSKLTYVCGFIMMFFMQTSLAQNLTPDENEVVEQLENIFNTTFPSDEPGGAVLVMKNGKTLLKKGYGLADFEKKVKSSPDDIYKIGSITKQFTAIAILMLEEQGKLNVTDPLSKYLPDFPNSDLITIEHLISHTSGIKNYTDMLQWHKIMSQPLTVNEVIDIFINEPLEFQPGESFSYSNSGYILLGAVIEQASGMNYAQFVEKKIFAKLKMKNTHYGKDNVQIKGAVDGYAMDNDSYTYAAPISMTQPYAAGAIITTVEDMYTWNKALFGGKIVSMASLKKAINPYILKNGESTGYGYGLVPSVLFDTEVVGHGGAINGFRAFTTMAPSSNTFVAVMSNNETKNPEFATEKALAITLGIYKEPQPVDLTEEQLQKYEGVYTVNENTYRTIYLENGKLMSQRSGGPAFALIPLGQDEFQYPNSFSKVQFEVSDNEITGMNFIDKGDNKVFCPKSENPLPEEKVVVKLEESHMITLEGVYEIAPSLSITIKLDNGTLQAQASGQPAFDIFPTNDYRFFLKVVDAEMEFQKDEQGTVNALVLYQGGQAIPGKKIID